MKIAVSYLKSSYPKEETIKKIAKTTADFIHVDLMDGKFVSQNNYDIKNLKELLKNTKKPLDIHLMTLDLETKIEEVSQLNPDIISFHIEQEKEILKRIIQIKEKKIKAGLAISPNTDIKNLLPYLKEVDVIIVMSVEPGYGGQKFLESTEERLQELKKYQLTNHFQIEVDGGINIDTIKYIKNLPDIVVSGTYICESINYEERIQSLR